MKLKVLVIFILICTIQGLVVDSSNSEKEIPLNNKINISPHNPISIDGDTQLNQTVQNEGWTGSGTEEDPYLIYDYFISDRVLVDGIYEVSLALKNIHQHVQIRENLLRSSSKPYGYGIYLYGCSNISIIDNNIEFYSIAIFISDSDDISIEGNEIFDVTAGSYAQNSGSIKYENNLFSNCSQYSFYILTTEKVDFVSNMIIFSGYDFMGGTANQFNDITSLQVSNNTFLHINTEGIAINAVSNAKIFSNSFIYCQRWDIAAWSLSSSNITRNQFTKSDETTYQGNLMLSTSNNNIVYENNFVSISPNVGHIFTETTGNLFYNSGRGNYYSKYTGEDNDSDGIGDTPYVIKTDVSDLYPLIEPVDLEKPIISDHDTELTYSVDDDLIISWTANDENPTDYTVYEGGSLVTSGTWVNGSNEVDLGNLSAGTYELVVNLLDKDGNFASFTVTVIINEITIITSSSTSPSTSSPSNETDPLGEIGDLISDNILVIGAVSGAGLVSIFILRRLFGGKKKTKKPRKKK